MDELERWTTAAIEELGIPAEVLAAAKDPVLDLVRVIAHGVNRPSAPLTAFLVGLSAGQATAGKTPQEVADAVVATVARIEQKATGWQPAED